jgi:hypothetical protein
MQNRSDLITLIRSKVPLIVIESQEELHAVELLDKAARQLNQPFFKWTATEGLHRQAEGYSPQRHNIRSQDVLQHLKSSDLSGLYLLLDFHPYLESPINIRLLKEIVLAAEQRGQTIILLSHQLSVPSEIAHLGTRFKLDLPCRDTLKKIVMDEIRQWSRQTGGQNPQVEKGVLNRMIRNLQGLSISEAHRLSRQAIHNDGAITQGDLPEMIRKKVDLLNRDCILSFEPDTAGFADIGGLKNLKSWLQKRKQIFQNGLALPGLPQPKGILLLGVQGCGKSLAAKVVAGIWGVPLLRLDIGAVYNKYIGETERNIRESLQTAERLGPCVLWIDEIEKGLSSRGDDSGTSQRVLSSVLTWMAEQSTGVFIVATANDIQALPPELIRKGRLDEIFFVDLPDAGTRQDIFAIHLNKRRLDPGRFDIGQLAAGSEGFSGAEIEQAVVAGLYSVLGGCGELDTGMLLDELKATKPLSIVMAERIYELRAWAEQRTVPAH